MNKLIYIIVGLVYSYNVYPQVSNKKSNKLLIEEGVYATYYLSEIKSKDFDPAYNVFYKDNRGYYWTGNPESGYQGSECYKWKIENNVLITDTFKSEYVNEDRCLSNDNFIQHWKIMRFKKNEIYLKLIKEINSGKETVFREQDQEIYVMKRIGNRL